MHEPLLTIVTVTFNAEKFLERTLESARKALFNIEDKCLVEYLIVDGNSRDATLDIAKRYQAFISKTISEPDKGLYDAMNKGIRHATGKYLWFLNAGDEVRDENVLKNLLEKLQAGGDVFYSDAMLVRDDGSEIGLRSVQTPHTLPQKLVWQDFALGMKVCHQAFIARKDIVPSYDIENLSADIDWEISCLKAAKEVHYLPFILCNYLSGGLSVQNHKKSLRDRFTVLQKHFGLLPAVGNHLLIFLRGVQFIITRGKYW